MTMDANTTWVAVISVIVLGITVYQIFDAFCQCRIAKYHCQKKQEK